MDASRSQDKGTWKSASRGCKITFAIFLIFMMLNYLVYAIYISTRHHFSNQLYTQISGFLFDYYDISDIFIPQQIRMHFAVNNPPIRGIFLTGALTVAVLFFMYVLLIRWQWRPWLVILGYFVLSFILWVVCLLLFWH